MAATAACAAALGGLGGGAAFAGEATGQSPPKTTPISNYVMSSICAFSGQNPEGVLYQPGDPLYEPGRTQSWGQTIKAIPGPGLPDYVDGPEGPMPLAVAIPGNSCNGDHGFLAGP